MARDCHALILFGMNNTAKSIFLSIKSRIFCSILKYKENVHCRKCWHKNRERNDDFVQFGDLNNFKLYLLRQERATKFSNYYAPLPNMAQMKLKRIYVEEKTGFAKDISS